MRFDDRLHEHRRRFPWLSALDMLYYELKGYGLDYPDTAGLRPKLHLVASDSMYSVVPLSPQKNSPHSLSCRLEWAGEVPPVRVKRFPWIKGRLDYFYVRSRSEWIQTLDDEVILNTNFNPVCRGCNFCSRGFDRYALQGLSPISAEDGIQQVEAAGIDLSALDEIAIVTGTFSSEDAAVQHVVALASAALERGFSGSVFYLGNQIVSGSALRRLLSSLGELSLRYAFTVETFDRRQMMHPLKRHSMQECLRIISDLAAAGVGEVQYTYIPGLDSLSAFEMWAPLLAHIAVPHISIFRPGSPEQHTLRDAAFARDPVGYLCRMRSIYEELYGRAVYGNNLGNLWPFPLARLNPVFASDEVPAGA